MKTILFTSEDVTDVVRRVGLDRLMSDAIEGIEKACRDFDEERHYVPVRSGFVYTEPHVGLLEWMPSMQIGDKVVVKLVGYHPRNPSLHGLPTILSTILTFDTATGHSLGLVDGTFLTALRTGAASAVASSVLARPDSRVLGLIGAGAQAVSQVHALSRVFDLEEVVFCDIDQSALDSFAQRCSILGLGDVRLRAASHADVVAAADILCTATSINVDEGPVFADENVRPHLHVNAVGSDFPGKIEVPLTLLQRSLVCPDFVAQAVNEGECQRLTEDEVGPDLVALVKQAARFHAHRDTPTVFDSTGWALEDYVVVDLLTRYGRETGCGTEVELESISGDPKDPYAFLHGALDAATADGRRLAGGSSRSKG